MQTMTKNHFPKLILASSIALALAGCGGSDDDDAMPMQPPVPAPPAMTAGDVFAITVSNKLVSFNRDAPGTIRTNVAVTGLQGAETLLGIDFRPADGLLYAVGSSGRLYTINPDTGAASVKSTLAADPADTTLPFTALRGTDYGVDFNPAADRLRVVSNTGQSLRINVDSGATTTDGAINGGAANAAVTASAYTNSFAGTATTTLYALDTANDTLYVQNPPNNGTLSLPLALGVDAGAANGMDIDARTNMAYAVLGVGGARNLYAINLAASTSPASPASPATSIGALGITEDIRGIALRAAAAPLAYGLSDDGRLLAFKPATPNTIDASVAVSGLNGGETLLGIDFRPKDGLLYGITSRARIVTIDPATGAATARATLAADAADTTMPYGALVGTAFAVDFNPVADRLRVIGDTGQNLRINVDTGAATTQCRRPGCGGRRRRGHGHRRRRQRPGAGGAAYRRRRAVVAVPDRPGAGGGHDGQRRGQPGDVGDRKRPGRAARHCAPDQVRGRAAQAGPQTSTSRLQHPRGTADVEDRPGRASDRRAALRFQRDLEELVRLHGRQLRQRDLERLARLDQAERDRAFPVVSLGPQLQRLIGGTLVVPSGTSLSAPGPSTCTVQPGAMLSGAASTTM
jgi:hypothetical protein